MLSSTGGRGLEVGGRIRMLPHFSPVLHSTGEISGGSVCGNVLSDCNQEKAESVSMHTVATHKAYRGAFLSMSQVKCFKCFNN